MFISSRMLRKNSRVLNLMIWMYFRIGFRLELLFMNWDIRNMIDRLNRKVSIGGILNRVLLVMVVMMVSRNKVLIIVLIG